MGKRAMAALDQIGGRLLDDGGVVEWLQTCSRRASASLGGGHLRLCPIGCGHWEAAVVQGGQV